MAAFTGLMSLSVRIYTDLMADVLFRKGKSCSRLFLAHLKMEATQDGHEMNYEPKNNCVLTNFLKTERVDTWQTSVCSRGVGPQPKQRPGSNIYSFGFLSVTIFNMMDK